MKYPSWFSVEYGKIAAAVEESYDVFRDPKGLLSPRTKDCAILIEE